LFAIVPVSMTAIVLIALACPLHATERIQMVGPSAGEEAAQTLMQSVAESCNNRDCDSFLAHFTPRKAASIRKTMRDLFTKHELEMEIQEVSVVSEADDRLVFDLKYGWHDRRAAKQVLDSKVVAVKTKGVWKIESEEVRQTIVHTAQGQEFDLGGGGQVVLNPADDGFWLPQDIGRTKGGCVGGQCGVRR
jgi:hypothetical protein